MSAKSMQVRQALGFNQQQYAEWIAAHELGHAITSLAMGTKVKNVEIISDKDGPTWARCNLGRARDRHACLVSLHGGYVADDRWYRHHGLWTQRRADISQSSARADISHIKRLTGSAQEMKATQDEAVRHIERHWHGLLRGATELAERGRISGRRIRSLM